MKKIKLTLYGTPRSKKNSLRAFKNVVLPSKAYGEYEKECHRQIDLMHLAEITEDVEVKALYYLKDRRKVDLHNLMQATADIISHKRKRINGKMAVIKPLILADDSLIKSWDGTRIMGIDKENPRTEIIIKILEDNKC